MKYYIRLFIVGSISFAIAAFLASFIEGIWHVDISLGCGFMASIAYITFTSR